MWTKQKPECLLKDREQENTEEALYTLQIKDNMKSNEETGLKTRQKWKYIHLYWNYQEENDKFNV